MGKFSFEISSQYPVWNILFHIYAQTIVSNLSTPPQCWTLKLIYRLIVISFTQIHELFSVTKMFSTRSRSALDNLSWCFQRQYFYPKRLAIVSTAETEEVHLIRGNTDSNGVTWKSNMCASDRTLCSNPSTCPGWMLSTIQVSKLDSSVPISNPDPNFASGLDVEWSPSHGMKRWIFFSHATTVWWWHWEWGGAHT